MTTIELIDRMVDDMNDSIDDYNDSIRRSFSTVEKYELRAKVDELRRWKRFLSDIRLEEMP